MNELSVRHLDKRYGRVSALEGASLEVPAGGVAAILGPNGAGKTTLLRSLVGLVLLDRGEGRILGEPVGDSERAIAIRARTSYVDRAMLDPWLSISQTLAVVRESVPGWDPAAATRALEAFGLPANRRVGALSTGMRTKFSLVLALCRRAELVILDEPTEGLDPNSRDDILGALAAATTNPSFTMLIATHRLEEVRHLVDHLCVIDRGRTTLMGSVDTLCREHWTLRVASTARSAWERDTGVVRATDRGPFAELLVRETPDQFTARTGIPLLASEPAALEAIGAAYMQRDDIDLAWLPQGA